MTEKGETMTDKRAEHTPEPLAVLLKESLPALRNAAVKLDSYDFHRTADRMHDALMSLTALMAAAPDMLAALHLIEDGLTDPAADIAREAIRKATADPA